MDITLLIQSLLGLISLLAILMFILLWNFKEKKKSAQAKEMPLEKKTEADTSLMALRKIIRNPNASARELHDALELVLKYHRNIHPKVGTRTHPDFDSYAEILFHLGRHKHVNKDILIHFDKELEMSNPSYKKEINDALMRGLDSRGA